MRRFLMALGAAALCFVLPRRDPGSTGLANANPALAAAASGAASAADTAAMPPPNAATPNPAAESNTCILCSATPPVPIVTLAATAVDSLARAFADANEAQLSRIDSIFGSPALDSRPAHDAHLLARLSTRNCYHLLERYASDGGHIYAADEATLRDVFREYSDVGLICIARLRSVRMGLGHVCLHYDLETKTEGRTCIGGTVMAYRVKDTRIEGRKRRVLSLDLPTSSSDVVEVLLAEHYTFEFDVMHGDGPEGPWEACIVDQIHGGWLRKWGTHRPQAFMFWASSGGTSLRALPADPRVGVRIYIPHLELDLPILPDIDFDDLRDIELPQPILGMPYLRRHLQPQWLTTDETLCFQAWGGYGDVPAALRQRFPNY